MSKAKASFQILGNMWVCFIHFLLLDILFTKDNFQRWWSMDDNYVGSLEAKGFFFPFFSGNNFF